MVAPLATPDQLGAFLGQTVLPDDATALMFLDIASGMVRDELEQQISQSTDVVTLDPKTGAWILLPEMPVTAVSLVEVYDGTSWSMADPSTYNVSLSQGIIVALGGLGTTWPTNPASWRVTYTHGYTTVPSSILGAVLGVAARGYASPVAVDSERLGGYQVKYALESQGFTALELRALSRYKFPRVA